MGRIRGTFKSPDSLICPPQIYINNIPVNWSEKELLPIVMVPGFVVKLRLMMLFSGDNRGFCYVLYANTEMAHNALNL